MLWLGTAVWAPQPGVQGQLSLLKQPPLHPIPFLTSLCPLGTISGSQSALCRGSTLMGVSPILHGPVPCALFTSEPLPCCSLCPEHHFAAGTPIPCCMKPCKMWLSPYSLIPEPGPTHDRCVRKFAVHRIHGKCGWNSQQASPPGLFLLLADLQMSDFASLLALQVQMCRAFGTVRTSASLGSIRMASTPSSCPI